MGLDLRPCGGRPGEQPRGARDRGRDVESHRQSAIEARAATMEPTDKIRAILRGRQHSPGNGRSANSELICQPGVIRLDDWADARTRVLASLLGGGSPNVIFLDAEERRWVSPRQGLAIPPAQQQAKVQGGKPAFSTEIGRDIHRHVRHGALWKVAPPLWTGLRALGFKEALAYETSMDHRGPSGWPKLTASPRRRARSVTRSASRVSRCARRKSARSGADV